MHPYLIGSGAPDDSAPDERYQEERRQISADLSIPDFLRREPTPAAFDEAAE